MMLILAYDAYFGMTFPSMQIHIYFQVRLPNVFDRGKTSISMAELFYASAVYLTIAIIYTDVY